MRTLNLPEVIVDEIIKKLIKSRQVKPKKLSESLSKLEEELIEATRLGNTRKINSVKNIIKRLKSKGPQKGGL
jgi:hypothetical protein